MACAELEQAKAQESDARNNLSYTEIKSPSNGVVGTLPYRIGALVGPNMAQPFTVVSDNAEMYAYFLHFGEYATAIFGSLWLD